MSIYHWLVILIVALSVLLGGNRKHNAAYIIVAFILLFCIQGLRDGATIGNDARTSYRTQFNSMVDEEWEDLGGLRDWAHLPSGDEEESIRTRNIALPWLMKLVSDLTDGDYQWFVAVVALIVLGALAFLIYRYSTSPVQSILYYLGILLFTFQMNATKQSVAMSLILLAFIAIVDQRPYLFLLLVLFASMFHFPALIFLPAYWVARMRVDRGYLLFLALLFLVIYFFRDWIVKTMADAYYNTEMETNSHLRFLANKVVVMLIVLIVALLIRPPLPEDRVYCILLEFLGIAAAIQTFAGYNNVFERLADYYFQFSVLLIPMIFDRTVSDRRYRRSPTADLISVFGPYIFGGFAIWRFLEAITNDEHFMPFRFFFDA